MNKLEMFVLKWTGNIIVMFGFCGAVGSIYIDTYRGYSFHIGHLQIIGIGIFLVTMAFGIFVAKFLHSVQNMMEKYLNS